MNIRNVAIIAHVDHGKTTLIDGLLKQTHTFRDNQAEMQQTTILDSNKQERERGITILAKNASIQYGDTKINIIDTPGHADFSGEVERVINMADGALLLVDAAEGPLPQTRFVLEKALGAGLKVILVINKIDRSDAQVEKVIAQTEELFLLLAQDESQLEFPILYTVAREGKAWTSLPSDITAPATLEPLLKLVMETVPAPQVNPEAPFKMQVANLDFDTYKGTYAIGKVTQGQIKPGQTIVQLDENTVVARHTVSYVFSNSGLSRAEVTESIPGDIIALTGVSNIEIGHTLADPSITEGYPAIKIGEPTLTIQISPNSSPFKGREGEFCTPRQLEERLGREKKTNVGIEIVANPNGSGFQVSGRGELHLAVMIENMRREGYELEVSKPQVVFKTIDGVRHEPVEELTIEIDKEFVGIITEELAKRRGELTDTLTNDRGVTRMVYEISSRNLLGFRTTIVTKTRGNGLFATRFLGFKPEQATMDRIRNGVIIATERGMTTAYALDAMQNRGTAFVGPGEEVYEGMIVGLYSRQEDIEMNVCKAKKLTNVRAASADMGIQLAPPMIMTLEQSLDFIEDDELLEVTPEHLRLRKRYLDKNERNKAAKRS